MLITILEIWNLSDEVVEESINVLEEKKYVIKTTCQNKKVQLYSMIYNKKSIFKGDYIERHLLDLLEETDGNLELSLLKYNERLSEYEEEKRKADELLNEYGTDRLEKTFKETMDQICPLNKSDDGSFYTYDLNGNRKLLSAHHLFQIHGHCYDINDVYRYITSGGKINNNEEYIKKFFNEKYIDLSGKGLTKQDLLNRQLILEDITYYNEATSVDISSNTITSLRSISLPKNLLILKVDNNPLINYDLRNSTELVDLSLIKCGINKNFDCNMLPNSIKRLNISNNRELINISNLNHLSELIYLDISDTGIDIIGLDKIIKGKRDFLTIRCNKTFIPYINSLKNSNKKKEIPSWIILEIKK